MKAPVAIIGTNPHGHFAGVGTMMLLTAVQSGLIRRMPRKSLAGVALCSARLMSGLRAGDEPSTPTKALPARRRWRRRRASTTRPTGSRTRTAFDEDRKTFDGSRGRSSDGLGPVYNATSCVGLPPEPGHGRLEPDRRDPRRPPHLRPRRPQPAGRSGSRSPRAGR